MPHDATRCDTRRMRSDDDDLQQVLTAVLARLDRIEELLVTVTRRSSVILGDMWLLRDEWHQHGFTGVERRRARGSG